ncbi:probable diphthine methyl ester synthase [Coffea eugenioides]|uniref:probable diphthine methyl ester synthase n=1 Tax=Coffea eugenioides TaxID=49369 RepID=UPI000F615C05|nr:probable diphthine methyl ester synthase [Coffea eugenioides]
MNLDAVVNSCGCWALVLLHTASSDMFMFRALFHEKTIESTIIGHSLLDIRVKEPSLESLCSYRGKKQYEPPRFMAVSVAIEQLLEVEQMRGENAYTEDTTCVGFARLGSEDQLVVAGSMKQLLEVDFGPPLHCLVIVGDTHPVEEEMLDFYKLAKKQGQA